MDVLREVVVPDSQTDPRFRLLTRLVTVYIFSTDHVQLSPFSMCCIPSTYS